MTIRGPMASSSGGISGKSIVGGPPAAARTTSAPRNGASSASVRRMPEVAEEDEVQVLGAEMDDRHLVLGQPLGRLEDVDGLDLDAAKDACLPAGSSRARIVSNGGTIWPRWL